MFIKKGRALMIGFLAVLIAAGLMGQQPVHAQSTRLDPELEKIVRKELRLSTGEIQPSDWTKLETVYANNREPIASLAGLEQAENLQELVVPHTLISDITVVKQLQKLTLLDITGDKVTDLSPLAFHRDLEHLLLAHNQIHDIHALLALPSLKEVDLSDNPLNAQAPSILAELEEKGVDVKSDLSPSTVKPVPVVFEDAKLEAAVRDALLLKEDDMLTENGLSNLEALYVDEQGITSLKGLEKAVNLKELYLSGNDVKSLEPISGLASLEDLDISANQVRDLSPLNGLGKLTSLDATDNDITSMAPIAGLKELVSLNLLGNDVKDYELLKDLRTIKGLAIGGEYLKDLSFLRSMPNLLQLALTDVEIADFSPLDNLDLQTIALGRTNLTQLTFLQDMKNLEYVALTRNPADHTSDKELAALRAAGVTIDVYDDPNLILSVVRIYIDGAKLLPVREDTNPVNKNGRLLVPLRLIMENLGATVKWDAATQTITATKGDIQVIYQLNNKTATINGRTVTLDVAPELINGRTMVPLRAISEALGAKVTWDEKWRKVIIETKAVQ